MLTIRFGYTEEITRICTVQFILSRHMEKFKEKLVISVYALLVSLVPPAPNLYTFVVSMLGLAVSNLAGVLILMYLWSRPPIQQTLVQPVMMLLIINFETIAWKDTIINFLGNCTPSFFQSIIDKYPLLLCGILNNHLIFSIVAYCLVILSTSKLILLFRPMHYHSANHDLIVRYIFLAIVIMVIWDTGLYFMVNNTYYCHSGTILRTAAIYNRTVNVTLIEQQTVNVMFALWDVCIFVLLIVFEIALIAGTLYKTRQNEIVGRIRSLKSQCDTLVQPRLPTSQRGQNQVQPLDIAALNNMYPDGRNLPQINNLTNDESNENPFNYIAAGADNPESSTELSNRRVVLLVATNGGLVILQRKGIYGTTFLCNLFIRFLEYNLLSIWVTRNQNFRAYALGVFAKIKTRLINQEL